MKLADDMKKIDFGDDLLPKLPSGSRTEDWMFSVLGYLQQYGVFFCVIICLMCLIFNRISKARKNPQMMRVWAFFAWGMLFLTVIFIVLPYIIIWFYEGG